MSTRDERELVEEYLEWCAESDTQAIFEEILHEFKIVRSIVENNNAQEWLDSLMDELLHIAEEWKENETW